MGIWLGSAMELPHFQPGFDGLCIRSLHLTEQQQFQPSPTTSIPLLTQGTWQLRVHRITMTETFQLEKAFMVTKSNHQSNPPCLITRPWHLELPHMASQHLQGWGPSPTPNHPSVKIFLLTPSLNLPWHNLRLFPHGLSLVT